MEAPNHCGGAEWPRGAPESPSNVTSTFFTTEHLLPKHLSFEHGGAMPNLLFAPGATKPWATCLLSQWMLHWWRANGSATREPLPCTHPSTPRTNLDSGMSRPGIEPYLPGLAARAHPTVPLMPKGIHEKKLLSHSPIHYECFLTWQNSTKTVEKATREFR